MRQCAANHRNAQAPAACPAQLLRASRSRRRLVVSALHRALRQPSTEALKAPEDVVYECLISLRKPDVDSLVPLFPRGFDPSLRTAHLRVGGQEVAESGPLACCHAFMDTAARRVLPGHLLRRCRVLSSMQLGATCQQRVALTACTGEEAVFVWRLRRTEGSRSGGCSGSGEGPAESSISAASSSAGGGSGEGPSTSGREQLDQQPAPSSRTARRGSGSSSTSSSTTRSSSSRGGPGAGAAGGAPAGVSGAAPGGTEWVVERVYRDDSHDAGELPPQPHPRCSPELVVKAQLAALQRGDVVGAAQYNLWSRSTSGGWELHLSAFRSLLRQPAYHALLTAAEAELGASALVGGRRLVQEVVLTAAGSRGAAGEQSTLVFQLGMQANGCWAVDAIRTA